MSALLKVSSLVDAISELIGKLIMWLVLACVLISAANAIVRRAFNYSSNAYLEIQWYLFAAVFMLGAGFVFLKNGHVRIDFVSSRLSTRTNAIIDIVGILLFVAPFCVLMVDLSWPLFYRAWVSGEMSPQAGGLIRWPVLLLMPVGFSLLLLQCVSELIKRAAYLSGHRAEPYSVDVHEKPDEIKLAEELMAEAEHKGQPSGGAR
ncbi:TRAP transporter small permease subunit [Calidifontimicrobium sp. SYSU G02091]|uniref:TRAP transporter small permease subunit n=1 Tax=Calidifontimicrobium sp. SYSU G02091 TaxID=2926421 RepID=UPI001F52D600|nr:TRAP transporter small permease subunit [Calidifontimicrobium sp. SYSU G02091]